MADKGLSNYLDLCVQFMNRGFVTKYFCEQLSLLCILAPKSPFEYCRGCLEFSPQIVVDVAHLAGLVDHSLEHVDGLVDGRQLENILDGVLGDTFADGLLVIDIAVDLEMGTIP